MLSSEPRTAFVATDLLRDRPHQVKCGGCGYISGRYLSVHNANVIRDLHQKTHV